MNDKDQIRICYAGRDELHKIATFLHESWQTVYRHIVTDDYLDSMSLDKRYTGLLQRYDEGSSEFLMLFDDNRLVGAAAFGKSFTEGYGEDGEISAIYLRSDYIGKGYGRRLFAEMEQALAANGYAYFVLDLLGGNTRALRFYLAHGYEIVAEHQYRLGDDHYPLSVMRKKAT
jgi:ribosomal protein S18 acetylase RimI-like enzyme